MKAPLHLLGHLDLGDAFVQNGLVNILADTEEIVWYVKPCYVADVALMMGHRPNITVKPAGAGYEDPQAKWLDPALRSIRLGLFNGGPFDMPRWDFEFYRQAHIPFRERWHRFEIDPELYMRVEHPQDFVLVHEDPARGFLINPEMLPADIEIVRILPGKSIWDWLPKILQAREIHAIDSSVLNLVESIWGLETRGGGNLFFHRYARPLVSGGANYPTLFKPWKVLD